MVSKTKRVTLADVIAKDPGIYVLTFGKHRTKMLKEIPLVYVRWLATNESENDNGKASRMARAYLKVKEPVLDEITTIDKRKQPCLLCKNEINGEAYTLVLRLGLQNHSYYAHKECIESLEGFQ